MLKITLKYQIESPDSLSFFLSKAQKLQDRMS